MSSVNEVSQSAHIVSQSSCLGVLIIHLLIICSHYSCLGDLLINSFIDKISAPVRIIVTGTSLLLHNVRWLS